MWADKRVHLHMDGQTFEAVLLGHLSAVLMTDDLMHEQ